MAKQLGREVEAPRIFVFGDTRATTSPEDISYEDAKTRISSIDVLTTRVHESPAELIRLRFESTTLPTTTAGMLRIHVPFDALAGFAIEEGWHPHIFVGAGDLCGGFGPRHGRCVNELSASTEALMKGLDPVWWVTDHIPGSTALRGADPKNGDRVRSDEEGFSFSLQQLGFLSSKWRSWDRQDIRLRGGARLFRVVLADGKPNVRRFVREGMLNSPHVNKMLA